MKVRVTSDHIETTAMSYAYELSSLKSIKEIVLLPNAYYDGTSLHGYVMMTDDVMIPSVLGNKAGRGTLVIKTSATLETMKLNSAVIRSMLIGAVHFDGRIGSLGGNDIVTLSHDKKGAVYIMVRGGAQFISDAVSRKFDLVAGKHFGLIGYKLGTKGYAEYALAYKHAETASRKTRMKIAETVRDVLLQFGDCEFKSVRDTLSHSISISGDGVLYRVSASEVGNVGVICGDMVTSFYLVGTRQVDGFMLSYPSTLGRTLGQPKAKAPVNRQTLHADMKGVDNWLDDCADLEVPFNFKGIGTIHEDCIGAVIAVNPTKAIVNLRS